MTTWPRTTPVPRPRTKRKHYWVCYKVFLLHVPLEHNCSGVVFYLSHTLVTLGMSSTNQLSPLPSSSSILPHISQRFEPCTCRTIGSCSGGALLSEPYSSHTWNAVSCSAKNVLCWNVARSSRMSGNWDKHRSNARSHACLYKENENIE